MPNLIGGIILGWIWQIIINGVLVNFEQTILSNSAYGYWGIILMSNWQNIGYMMVIYIAALQTVNTDLIEAAEKAYQAKEAEMRAFARMLAEEKTHDCVNVKPLRNMPIDDVT